MSAPRTGFLPFVAAWYTVVLFAACTGSAPPIPGNPELPGGGTTTHDLGENAFNHPAANLSDEEHSRFAVGNSFFRQNWVTAPASTTGRDGLGPLFNARSCSGCHLRDGRGQPPDQPTAISGLLVRLGILSADSSMRPHPVYGDQLQPFGILGVPGEGQLVITHDTIHGAFEDGTPYTLLYPRYGFSELAYGPMGPVLISPRVAQQLPGLGLLEAIPEAELEANAANTHDGISGRMNRVLDIATGRTVVGRFGWKANEPSVRQQAAAAFNGDLGITSSLFPVDHCTATQTACTQALNGNAPGEHFELKERTLDLVAFYTATLGVPVRRGADDAEVKKGEELFRALGCAACHRPSYTTGHSAISPALAQQRIFPYTDLLLHDMGAGLADNRPDQLASGSEWRTPPLWGIGLFPTTNGHTRYLHDGRARDLNEAILWHGGEALPARERYLRAQATERAALLAFLNSL